jgi:hypothetical protein
VPVPLRTLGKVARRSDDAAVDRIVKICSAGTTDARALRLELLTEIRRGVGFDAYAWLLTDPETSVGAAPLADVPCLPELPRLIRSGRECPADPGHSLESGPKLDHEPGGRYPAGRTRQPSVTGSRSSLGVAGDGVSQPSPRLTITG